MVVFAHAGVKVHVSSRRNGHFCFRASNLACRASSCLSWPLPSVFQNAENARTIRQKVLRPPAGAPRHEMCVFYGNLQLKLASGLKSPTLFRASGTCFQGPPRGLRHGSPGPGAPRRRQEAPKTAKVRFLLYFTGQKLASGLNTQGFQWF